MDDKKIYQVHETIGFPPISEKDQANILISNNAEVINKLTPKFKATYIPSSVGKQYIKLTKEEFRPLFINSRHIEDSYNQHLKHPDLECCWVEKTKDSSYHFFCSERGVSSCRKSFEDYDSMIDYLVDLRYQVYGL